MMKKTFVIHPFLLAAYPVLFLYSQNLGEVAFHETLAPIAVIFGLTLIAWGVLGFILKNRKKSGVIVSLFLVLFFSYGYCRTPLESKKIILLVSLIWILLFATGTFLTARSKKDFTKATIILNVIAGILIAQPILNIIYHNKYISRHNDSALVKTTLQRPALMKSYPDIYFIVLDAYAREDILRDLYNFDNSEFLNFLKGKGFYIADESASNYGQTGLSLGACFTLSYLDEKVKTIGLGNVSRESLDDIIRRSIVIDSLKRYGYKIVAFVSNRTETNLQDVADVYLDPRTSLNMFRSALKNMTPLPDIMAAKKTYSDFDKHRQNILYILDNIGKVAGDVQSPKFVFAHIESPHPPFVFGPNGEVRNPEARFDDHDGNWLIRPGRLSLEQYHTYYRDQIIFLNSRMKKVVEKILRDSKQPPIIMILGDHGPRSETVWEQPEETNMKECMSNLNAYYLPNNGSRLLYPQITPVNSFRIIFNYYFGGTSFKLLPDKSYFSSAIYLYKFYDVTERVRGQHEDSAAGMK